MNVSTKSHVIGEIPADVVWVFINHDLVAVPKPVIAETNIVGGNVEIKPAKPEAPRAASFNPDDVAATETAGKVSMFPGMIDVVVSIIGAGVVSDPFAIRVNVGSVWVPGLVTISVRAWCWRRAPYFSRGRTMSRNVAPAANTMRAMLRKRRDRNPQQHCKKTDKLLQFSLL